MRVRLPPGGALSRPQRRLAAELVEQAGLAFHNLRLDASLRARAEALARDTEEIAASRRRLLAAEDTEREHLLRAIQREVGRYLRPIAGELDRLPALLHEDRQAAAQVLQQLEVGANQALDALRDLAHGLFPDLLALRGLPAALAGHAQRSGREVVLDVADEVRGLRLPPAVEAAGYFCCVETLVMLADAHVRVGRTHDQLRIICRGRVTGDLPPEFEQRLTDRVEAVGGSLQVEVDSAGNALVAARLPLLAADVAAAARSG
jgi:signal transduction histidine kinase